MEEGCKIDLPMGASPFYYERAAATSDSAVEGGLRRGKGKLHTRPLETLPGTAKNKGRGHVREYLVLRVLIMPAIMFCFDGATLLAMSGVSLRSKHADPFSSEQTDNMGAFLEVRVLGRGKSLTDLAEDMSPGCSDPQHRDHWFIAYIVSVNRHSCNSELQAITREPPRQREPQMAEGLGRQARDILGDARQSDGRTDVRQPYADAGLRSMGYVHDAFTPGINGDCADAATRKLACDVVVRVPVAPKLFARPLNDAAWRKVEGFSDDVGSGDANGRGVTGLPILACFGLCIIHCGMRTLESTLRLVLTIASDRYLANKGKDRKLIDYHLNKKVWEDLRLRRLISVNNTGGLNRVTLNGEEVRGLIKDLTSGDSKLLRAIRATYEALSAQEQATHLNAWAVVFGHWARAMRAAYVLRASAADRQTFREEVKCYVTEKAKLRPGACCWYDWQLFSVMTEMFDKFESLMLISQEGMEACQKRNNMLMRLGNNFSNAGRIPWRVIQAGVEAVRTYMAERKKKKKSPAEWLWWRNVMSFFTTFKDVFERVETYKREGRTLDWRTEFSPQWVSCIALTILVCRIKARARRWRPSERAVQWPCAWRRAGACSRCASRTRARWPSPPSWRCTTRPCPARAAGALQT